MRRLVGGLRRLDFRCRFRLTAVVGLRLLRLRRSLGLVAGDLRSVCIGIFGLRLRVACLTVVFGIFLVSRNGFRGGSFVRLVGGLLRLLGCFLGRFPRPQALPPARAWALP